MLVRFLNRQYDAVFRLAETCVSDTQLSDEESQIFAQFALLKDDNHPDAHACRLKISLATLASREAMECEWSVIPPPKRLRLTEWGRNIEDEMSAYISKYAMVSACCRLTAEVREPPPLLLDPRMAVSGCCPVASRRGRR
jgi:hypothetical protein